MKFRAAVALAAVCVGAGALVLAVPAGALGPANVALVSSAPAGAPNATSGSPSVSLDGRYIAFDSDASNLVANDTNGVGDVFVRDTANGTTTRVSVGNTGAQLTGWSHAPSISADGRYVAFLSEATSAVTGDTNGVQDAFVRDTVGGTTKRVSVDAAGAQGAESVDEVSISGDGRWIAFSTVSALVSTDTNGDVDVYTRDTSANTTVRISTSSNGGWEPSADGTGRYYSYSGPCGSTACIYRRDRQNATTAKVSVTPANANPNNQSYESMITSDGTKVVFTSEASNIMATLATNATANTYLRNLTTSTTTLVSVSGTAGETNDWMFEPFVSDDGRYVAFTSIATNLTATTETDTNIDVYVRDLTTGTNARISQTALGGPLDGASSGPALARNGSSIAFLSFASNLVSGATARGQVYRASLSSAAVPSAPRNVSAAAGNASATVSWDPPASDGGASISGYLVTANPGGSTATAGGTATSITVAGLTNGTTYTFTVRAQNEVGFGPASSASNSVKPQAVTTAPSAPQNVSASAGDAGATVTWDPPASDGGASIIGYLVISNPGGITAAAGSTATGTTVSGLTNETAYTFTVRAQNSVGYGPDSTPSNSVTPHAAIPADTISVGDVAVLEGDAATRIVKFPVTLSHAATHEVTVNYTISNVSATGAKAAGTGVDYANLGGVTKTLRFKPALTTGLTKVSATISVKVFSDTDGEGDETFRVTLSAPTGGYQLNRSIGTGTIINDDVAAGSRLAIGDASIMRAANGVLAVSVPVTLSTSRPAKFTVPYSITGDAVWSAKAAGGGDYGGKSNGTISCAALKVACTLNIKLWPGAPLTVARHLTITLSVPSDAAVGVQRAVGTVTLLAVR